MKKKNRLIPLILAVVLCLACSACGTSAFSNAESYRREVSSVLDTWFAKPDRDTASHDESQPQAGKIAAPGEFTLSANGDYSFTGVEYADYYLLYFCTPDATDDRDPFLFSSDPIPAAGQGGESYSGNVSDLLRYGYGEYLVKVFAFPDVNDNAHSVSVAATAGFSVSGTQDAPVIDYLWNTFDNTVYVQLTNINDYTYQVYPDSVDVTFTDVENTANTVVVTLSNLSPENSSVKSDALTPGTTYNITAVSHSASQFVSNADSDMTNVAEMVTFAGHNNMSENYNYTDGIARNSFSYPQVMENVSLTGPSAYKQHVVRFGSPGTFTFTTTPTAANAGSAHSFIVAADSMPFSFDDATLELFPDGTFEFNQYAEMPPQGPSSIRGIWTDNGDGTVTLSYDHTTLHTSVDG